MKKLVLLILSLLTIQISAISQPCLPEGITFTTQSQIDSFQINYPNCTEIEGTVWIEGEDITNLMGLNDLTNIWDHLFINCNYQLNSLTGLENLTKVNGRLYIAGNPISNFLGLNNLTFVGDEFALNGNNSLINFEGLENLTAMNGGFFIHFNNSLSSFYGLHNLTSIEGHFKFTYNSSLTNFTGLENLTQIGEYFEIQYTDLMNFNGLDNLSNIGEYLIIQGNNLLTDISGLENLNTIQENLWIFDNHALISLSGLENLNFVGGDISISTNTQLTSLDGLDNIYPNSMNNLDITRNFLLTNCNVQSICDYLLSPGGSVNIYENGNGCSNPTEVASSCGYTLPCLPYGNYHLLTQSDIDEFQTNYPGCSELGGDTYIHGYSIENLNGLSVINSIGESLRINNNGSLTDLAGLENLVSVGNDLRIMTNTSLIDISNLNNLTTIGGKLIISSNIALPNLNGLENITSLGGDLYLFSNLSLTDINSLETLSEIGGSLRIVNHNKLTNITGLNNINSIGGFIEISSNDSLSSLIGIDNLDEGSIEELTITYNSSLSMCHVESICDYLASPNADVSIYDNAPGCNSIEEVEDACDTVSIHENNFEDSFIVSPNPCSNHLNLNFTIFNEEYVVAELFEISGNKVKDLLNETKMPGTYNMEFDISNLPTGVYLIRFQTNNGFNMKRLVKK